MISFHKKLSPFNKMIKIILIFSFFEILIFNTYLDRAKGSKHRSLFSSTPGIKNSG